MQRDILENFFIDYRDPIFGLIILISAALVVATASYVWGVFSKKDEKNRIENFIRKFDSSNGLSAKHKELLRSVDVGSEALGILATVFSKSGDFEKAINVYLIALEQIKDRKEKEFILTNLGKVYFQAGFLKKSEDIFLESLKLSPRSEVTLKHLGVIYEKLKLYDNELEVLDALKEQGINTDESAAFVKTQMIANDRNLSFDKKMKEIMTFSRDFDFVLRLVLELHLQHHEPLVKIKKFPNLASCIDIIWHLNEPINLRDKEYKALFFSKNLSNEFEQSSFFEINSLSAMRKSGFFEADLNFKYLCKECKNSLPTHFYRCPICYSLQSVEILPKIVRKDNEIDMPF